MFSTSEPTRPVSDNFRSHLYARYVSTFKDSARPVADDQELKDYWAWSQRKLLPLIADLDRGAPVLELGCGLGRLLWILEREGFEDVRGIDVSDEMVALAQKASLPVEKADVFEFLANDDRNYGLVVALDFLEHFTKEELMKLLPAIRERLAPGGTLLVQAPNAAGLLPNHVVYGDLTHSVVLNPSSLQQLLRVAGFVDISFFETGPVAKNLKGAMRVVLWSAIKLAANAVRIVEVGRTQEVWTENMICRCRKEFP